MGQNDRHLAGRAGIDCSLRRGVLIGKGGLYGDVIRTGLMLNPTKDTVDEICSGIRGRLRSE